MAQLAADTWLVAPYNTDEDWLSYTTLQQHPGNGVAATYDGTTGDATLLVAERFSVAKTQRGYCTPVLGSTVRSLTVGMRQAYGSDAGTGTIPDIDRPQLLPTS